MTRTVDATSYADQRAEFVYLYDLEYSDGWLYLTNAAADIDANGVTYSAVGGNLIHEAAQETEDQRSQGVDLTLFGVDQTIISQVLTARFRGYRARIWLYGTNLETAAVEGGPHLIFRGLQLSDYSVTEDRAEDGGKVEVKTRLSSKLGAVNMRRGVRANPDSHNEMLRRAGVASPSDTAFDRVLTLMNRPIYWGTDAPDVTTGGTNGGDDGGGDGTPPEERVDV